MKFKRKRKAVRNRQFGDGEESESINFEIVTELQQQEHGGPVEIVRVRAAEDRLAPRLCSAQAGEQWIDWKD